MPKLLIKSSLLLVFSVYVLASNALADTVAGVKDKSASGIAPSTITLPQHRGMITEHTLQQPSACRHCSPYTSTQ